MSTLKKTCLVIVLLSFAAHAQAQTELGPDPAKVRVRMGPLWMNPSIALTNLGVDNNVFNDETDPKSDFTFTVSPRTELWLRAGRTWFHGTIIEDLVWYQDFDTERAANGSYSVNWLVPLNRLTMDVGARRLHSKQRQGYEIDERAYRLETGYSGSASYRFLAKTSLRLNVGWQHTEFDEDAEFRNVNLREELSRKSTTTGVSIAHQVTPLTTISVEFAREAVRFDFTPDRDTNSNLVLAKVAFDPLAAMQGSASFGYREFTPVAADVPGYNGTTAAVDLSYKAFGTTKFTGKYVRDVQFSYDSTRPYYLENSYSVEVIQQLFGPVDVAVRAGRANLAYRDRAGTPVAASDQPDRTLIRGAGVGYHLGQDIRIGVNVDQQKRTSPIQGHSYEGLRLWTSVSYGL
jgi:hypothetical protein